MATFSRHDVRKGLAALKWPLRLTFAGLLAERVWRAFWPLLSLMMLVLGLNLLADGLREESLKD